MQLEANKQHLYYQFITKIIDSVNQPLQKGELSDGLKTFNAVGLQNIPQAQLAIRGV